MHPSVDKLQLLHAIIQSLETLVDNARNAVQVAYETATHEENIAENKYDTLGLEAAYLTQGHARRLAECEADLAAFRALVPRSFTADDTIAIGALVQVNDSGQEQYLFLGPAAGGLKLTVSGLDILVITASSPLGKALLNASAGDTVTVQVAAGKKHYDIIDIV